MEYAQPVHMCFVDLEKAYDYVLQGVLWGVLWEQGVDGLLSQSGVVSTKATLCWLFYS